MPKTPPRRSHSPAPPLAQTLADWFACASRAGAAADARLAAYYRLLDHRDRLADDVLSDVRALEPALAEVVRAAGGSVPISNALTCFVDARGRLALRLPV